MCQKLPLTWPTIASQTKVYSFWHGVNPLINLLLWSILPYLLCKTYQFHLTLGNPLPPPGSLAILALEIPHTFSIGFRSQEWCTCTLAVDNRLSPTFSDPGYLLNLTI